MQEKAKVFKIITVAAIIFIVLLSIAMIMNFVKLSRVNSRQKMLEAELYALEMQYENNLDEIEYKQSAEYITRHARSLGLKGAGETVFGADGE